MSWVQGGPSRHKLESLLVPGTVSRIEDDDLVRGIELRPFGPGLRALKMLSATPAACNWQLYSYG